MAVQTQRHPGQFPPAHFPKMYRFPTRPRLIWGQMIGFANRMASRVIIYAVKVARALNLLFAWQRLNFHSYFGV